MKLNTDMNIIKNENIQSKNEEIIYLKNEIKQLNDKYNNLESKKTQLNNENIQLKKEINNIKDKEAQLMNSNFSIINDINFLKNENTQLKNEVNRLTNDNNQFKNEIYQLKGENNQLKNDIDYLKNNNAQLINDNILLKNNEAQMKIENEQLKKEITELKDKSNILWNEIKMINKNSDLDSKIINGNEKYNECLKNWINPLRKIKAELFYRLSENEDNVSTFHKLCDNKGSTLTLFHVKDGNIIGIYTPFSWNTTSGEKNDMDTFIFNLNKNQKYKKLIAKYSILCDSSHGPWAPFFGCIDSMKSIRYIASINKYYDKGSEILPNNNQRKEYDLIEAEVYKIIIE